jgi:hypothetical protein
MLRASLKACCRWKMFTPAIVFDLTVPPADMALIPQNVMRETTNRHESTEAERE